MDKITFEEFKEIIVNNSCKCLKCLQLDNTKKKAEFWRWRVVLFDENIIIIDKKQRFIIKRENSRVINISRRLDKTLMCITYIDGSYIEVVLDLKTKEKATSNGTGNTSVAFLQLKQNHI